MKFTYPPISRQPAQLFSLYQETGTYQSLLTAYQPALDCTSIVPSIKEDRVCIEEKKCGPSHVCPRRVWYKLPVNHEPAPRRLLCIHQLPVVVRPTKGTLEKNYYSVCTHPMSLV